MSYSTDRGGSPATHAGIRPAERRRSLRRPLRTVGVIARLCGSEELNRLDVVVMDASEKEVGLRCPFALERGAIYRLRIGFRAAAGTKATCFVGLIRVTRCLNRADGTFDVGARFQATPAGWSG